jgi:diguanylate cyclase (GGDEF)-like protein
VPAGEGGLPCPHVPPTSQGHALCLPLVAQGEVLAVLHVSLDAGAKAATDSKLALARAAAEPIAMALANLRLRETLQAQSIRDPLTGLFNRRFLQEAFVKFLSRARRESRPVGVIVLDVDHFKRFNDTFGHAAGDVLLGAVGTLLGASFRQEDIACRFGGEEFVVVLPNASLEDTVRRAEQLRTAIAALSLQHQGTSLGAVTASLGVSAFPQHGGEGDALIEAADAALYRAKHGGRNQVVVAAAKPIDGPRPDKEAAPAAPLTAAS